MRRYLHLPCELRSYEKLKQDTDEKSHLGVSDELPFLTSKTSRKLNAKISAQAMRQFLEYFEFPNLKALGPTQ